MKNENKKGEASGEDSIHDEKVRVVYFVGIGGIGMSALARYFHERGVGTSGYDRTPSSLTKELEKSGIPVHYEENTGLIPKDADWVIYTPAVPADHAELVYYRQHGYKVIKRSDVLQKITNSSFNICVAGTHGKTTISTMIAHLLRYAGYGCNAFLGGISVNYGTNYWSDPNNVVVVEADEYDRSFLKLSPDIAVISAMDPDHLDIYGTAAEMENAFLEFGGRIKKGGLLVIRQGIKRGGDLKVPRRLRYSLQDKSAEVYAENISIVNGSYLFDVVINGRKYKGFTLHTGGLHNVENLMAAIAVTSSLEVDPEMIRKGAHDFKGVKRRFEYIIPPGQTKAQKKLPVFIDDYAHHPEELRALILGVRNLFSDSRCTLIFQPHLYTRTRDLAVGFAEVLGLADEVILLPVYPAREKPIEGVNSGMIKRMMKNNNTKLMEKQELLNWLENAYCRELASANESMVLVTAGAGDIDAMVEPIKKILLKN